MNYDNEENRKAGRIAMGIVGVVVLAGGAWWFWHRSNSTPETEAAAVATQPDGGEVAAPAGPAPIEYPLQEVVAEQDEALPADPDQATEAALQNLFAGQLARWLVTDELARRLVATVDNLPRNTSIEKVRPLRAPDSPFEVEREVLDPVDGTERITVAASNHARYDTLVALLARTDAGAIAASYRSVYPQLQAAYEDLGYPGRYFNDRVVSVIDHLLATPEPAGPLLLEQPKVLYRYADPALEALSPGQKLLLRMGNAHARTVKQKLREIRAQITRPAE